jgi:hypothetical protein
MIKATIAGSVFVAALLALSHPTPFRIPDYIAKRTRVADTLKEGDAREAFGNFNGDSLSQDRAYVVKLNTTNPATVEIRFTNLIPIIQLPEKYDRVVHIEQTGDLNKDGADDLYFIAMERQSCNAVGIVTSLRDGRWAELQTLRQFGCTEFTRHEHKVEKTENGFYYITYHVSGEDNTQRFRGTIK